MKKISNLKKPIISIVLILTLVITVVPAYSSAKAKVKLNKKTVKLYVGKTTTLKLKNNKKKVKWSSSNKKVATVSKKGKVKAIKKGKATITAKVGKKKYKCKVTVKVKNITPQKKIAPTPNTTSTSKPTTTQKPSATPIITPTQKPTPTPKPALESISFDKEEVEIEAGDKMTLEVKPYPEDNADLTKNSSRGYPIWESSDKDIVEIKEMHTNNNNLQATIETHKRVTGTATITVKYRGIVAICMINVVDKEAELILSEDGTTILGVTNYDTATVINIPNTVTTIGEHAFYKDNLNDCEYVKTLQIPSSVTTIENYAFCRELESIYIPSSVTSIGYQNISYDCIIYTESGSYAEQWAKDRHASQKIEIISE